MYKMMVVDDSNIIRNKIERCQEKGGFKVVHKAKNGQEAVDFCKRLKPDVITMDLTMPEKDGIDAIKEIIEIHPDVRILVVSALSDKATGIRALSLGARGFLTKPFTDEELLEALKELLI